MLKDIPTERSQGFYVDRTVRQQFSTCWSVAVDWSSLLFWTSWTGLRVCFLWFGVGRLGCLWPGERRDNSVCRYPIFFPHRLSHFNSQLSIRRRRTLTLGSHPGLVYFDVIVFRKERLITSQPMPASMATFESVLIFLGGSPQIKLLWWADLHCVLACGCAWYQGSLN